MPKNNANTVAVRYIANVNSEGEINLSRPFRTDIADAKHLCQSYGMRALYCVRLTSVRKDAPGGFEFAMATLGLDFETHGNA